MNYFNKIKNIIKEKIFPFSKSVDLQSSNQEQDLLCPDINSQETVIEDKKLSKINIKVVSESKIIECNICELI